MINTRFYNLGKPSDNKDKEPIPITVNTLYKIIVFAIIIVILGIISMTFVQKQILTHTDAQKDTTTIKAPDANNRTKYNK